MIGWVLSGFIGIGDIRDLAATAIRLDAVDSFLNAIALIPYLGDAERTVAIVGKFTAKHPNKAVFIFVFVIDHIPVNSVVKRIEVLKKTHGEDVVNRLIGRNIPEDLLEQWGKRFPLKRVDELMTNGATLDEVKYVIDNSKNFDDVTQICKDSRNEVRYFQNGYAKVDNTGKIIGGFGWEKVLARHWYSNPNQFKQAFGTSLTIGQLEEMATDTIKTGNWISEAGREQIEYYKLYRNPDDGVYRYLTVTISDRVPMLDKPGIGKGNMITVHPGR